MTQNLLSQASNGSQYFNIKNWYKETFSSDFYMHFHIHPQFELMYCAKGYFSFDYKSSAADEKYESVHVYENSFILINSCYHRLTIHEKGTTIYNIELEALPTPQTSILGTSYKTMLTTTVKDILSINPELAKLAKEDKPFFFFSDTQNILNIIKNIVDETSDPRFSDSLINIQLNILKLFIAISRCMFIDYQVETGYSYIRKAINYIKSDFNKQPSVDEIAKVVGVSTAYLQKLFKKELNKTIHLVLTEIKLNTAKTLLQTTNLPQKEIAKLCGLNSREQLIYEFKKIEKCTPNEYRVKIKGKQIRHFSELGEIELR